MTGKYNLHTKFQVSTTKNVADKLCIDTQTDTQTKTDRSIKTEGPILVTSPCLVSFSLDVEWSSIKKNIRSKTILPEASILVN